LTLPPERRAYVVGVSDNLYDLLDLGIFLEERGIPCSLEEAERRPTSTLYRLWVGEDAVWRDIEDLRREFTAQQTRGESLAGSLPAADECPACCSKVPPESTECPACGLVLRGEGDEKAGDSETASPVTLL
jgi:hypothetical protein